MSKIWNGPIPLIGRGFDRGFSIGFFEAMNSPEVRAMYEALKPFVTDSLQKDRYIRERTVFQQAAIEALAAYEAELVEEVMIVVPKGTE